MAVFGGIIILDFGSQFTQLIARRVRELGVYSEIKSFNTPLEEIKKLKPSGVILSGGPSSVYDPKAPLRDDLKELLNVCPVLGLCYGMQLLAHQLGGLVEASSHREYGRTKIKWSDQQEQNVWMSHGDLVKTLPAKTEGLAKSQSGHWAAMQSLEWGHGFMGLQFHPEVSHTEKGEENIKKFIFDMCHAVRNWGGPKLVDHLISAIRSQVGDESVLCALSGGVDSTVTATLLLKALGRKQLQCVFVDSGLLRLNEASNVMKGYEKLDLPVVKVDSQEKFLRALSKIEDPEKKRKAIGKAFIEVFEKATEGTKCRFLAQGTLYPDVIESVNIYGQSVTIKSHHNVGGLPEKMNLKLVEPLRELFKDEVRVLGRELEIPDELLMRHPFPGPGLAIRILGEVTEEDLNLLRKADDIFISELKSHQLYGKIWQAFAVLLPTRSVGVMGDHRTYDKAIALRAVTSRDGMTADWFAFEPGFLAHVSNRIVNEVKGINRVVYDISSKPPATIEWE